MIEDLRNHKHAYYFRTDESQTSDSGILPGHPLSKTVTVRTPDGGTQDLIANDVFRVVHDSIAHSEGPQFGPHGEKMAWWTHRNSLPREAHLALWCETRGLNTYTNAGPHLHTTTENGGVRPIRRGEPGFLPNEQRPFPPSKCVIVPEDLY